VKKKQEGKRDIRQEPEREIKIGRLPVGPFNAVTDVKGVLVGHKTVLKGEGRLGVTSGVARTGVSVLVPHGEIWSKPVYAGTFALNGNGEMTGTAWIEESGLLTTPVGLTNTHSVGVVRDALIEYRKKQEPTTDWLLPVVAETWDGYLSDINGMHVSREDVFEALEEAKGGPVPQGNVGGGTGMVCFEFKGGIGSSSRLLEIDGRTFTVGVLVQANFGARYQFRLGGLPLGELIGTNVVPGRLETERPVSGSGTGPAGKKQPGPGLASRSSRSPSDDTGSIIVIIATDVPLLPDQCKRLARRASLGLGRMGSISANSSGDIFLAFSTGNICEGFLEKGGEAIRSVATIKPDAMSLLFEAAVEAVEESIFNALRFAETMTGIDGRTIHALPMDRVKSIFRNSGQGLG
jgi:D-aminopeptidase